MPLAAQSYATLHQWEVRSSEARLTVDTGAAARVASIVGHRSESGFVLLLQLADRHFSDEGFEDALAVCLRQKPALIEMWETWSADQRWTPSAYVEETMTGWFDGARRYVRVHPDRAAAVADFIHRLAAWLSRRAVLTVDE